MKPILNTELYALIEALHGRFLVNKMDRYVGESLLVYGEYSELEWNLLEKITPVGAVVIEAGANMGSFTVPLAKKVGQSGIVYAFEPQLSVFQQLCANLALNDLYNVQAFNAGCGESGDWMPIARPHPGVKTNFGGLSLDALKAEGNTRIRVEKLDEILKIERLDLIKADVEGMELAVLKGAKGLIDRFRPLLYLEAHDPDESPELIEWLQEMKYDMWWHLPAMYRRNNHRGFEPNIFGRIVSFNMVCAPKEKRMDFSGIKAVTGPKDHPKLWQAVQPTAAKSGGPT